MELAESEDALLLNAANECAAIAQSTSWNNEESERLIDVAVEAGKNFYGRLMQIIAEDAEDIDSAFAEKSGIVDAEQRAVFEVGTSFGQKKEVWKQKLWDSDLEMAIYQEAVLRREFSERNCLLVKKTTP